MIFNPVEKAKIEHWLDNQYYLTNCKNTTIRDISFYNGAIQALHISGIDICRDSHGYHHLNNKE